MSLTEDGHLSRRGSFRGPPPLETLAVADAGPWQRGESSSFDEIPEHNHRQRRFGRVSHLAPIKGIWHVVGLKGTIGISYFTRLRTIFVTFLQCCFVLVFIVLVCGVSR